MANKVFLLTLAVLITALNIKAQDDKTVIKKMLESEQGVDIVVNDGYDNISNNSYFSSGGIFYYTEKSELFSTEEMLAVKDINFKKSNVAKSNYATDQKSKSPVYILELIPLSGKCKYKIISKTEKEAQKTSMRLAFATQSQANAALTYLKEMPEGGYANSTTGKSTVTNENETASQSSLNSKYSCKYPSDFDSQLLLLIMGLKDNYAALQGVQVKESILGTAEYECKINLEQAINTTILKGSFNFLNVEFGEYELFDDALKMYYKIQDLMTGSPKLPCSLKQTENKFLDDNSTWTIWEVSDEEFVKKEPLLAGFSIKISLMNQPSVKLLRKGINANRYRVVLTINP